jgi:hypothetical protein
MESAFFTVHGVSWLGMVYVVLGLSIPKRFSYASRLAIPEKRKTVGGGHGTGDGRVDSPRIPTMPGTMGRGYTKRGRRMACAIRLGIQQEDDEQNATL